MPAVTNRGGVTVIILTFNEAIHIERAIVSVQPFATMVYVVDSQSTDDTAARARAAGATVVTRPFVNQAEQFNWALDTLPVTTGWIMRLDADETIGDDLARRIVDRLPTLPTDIVGIDFDRKHIFLDRWIRHGGRYPLRMIRLWRTGHGRIEDRWMDEHVVIQGGRIDHFAGDFRDHNLNDLSYFTAKHNDYATREALQRIIARDALLPDSTTMTTKTAAKQTMMKRWIKNRVYDRLPFWLAAALYFVWRYLFQLGFLDGRPGLIYHGLQGFWYRFLVGAKIVEYDRTLRGVAPEDRLDALGRLTGRDLAVGRGRKHGARALPGATR